MRALTRRLMLSATTGSLLLAGSGARSQTRTADTEWRSYGNDLAHTRYAPLDQIDAKNFGDLEVAWRFKTDKLGSRPEYILEATPLLIKGRLFTTAGARRDALALDAATGEILWVHRMDEGVRAQTSPRQLSGRGVGYWSGGTEERILYVTIGYQLVSLDAKTGIPDPHFGVNGVVDLKLDDDQELDLDNSDIGLHTAPTIAKGVAIIGAAHTAGNVPKTRFNAKGYVRGFDVKTGKRLWIFHTIPKKGEFGYDTWLKPGQAEEAGNAGDWAQISADEELGLAYLGVELPTGDQMGLYRAGPALFGESIVAVDILTGQRKWHYQIVHHGLWDYDICSAAILCDIPHNGQTIKALALPTKQAFLFVLNRETGEPVWPIHEKKVPKGDVPGEWYSATQPTPSKPPAYDRQGVTEADLIDFTPELHQKALEIVKHYKMGPVYTAPILAKENGPYGVLNLPGYIGGSNWPGGAYDPETHTVYLFSQTNLLTVGSIVANPEHQASDFDYVHANLGQTLHTDVGMGAPPPGGGRRRPPAAAMPASAGPRPGQTDVEGLPLIKPPYGRISAINLEKGDITWQVAHGETPDFIRNHPALKGLKIPRTGQIGKIAPLVTKSLVICGDPGQFTDQNRIRGARLRAYDKATGEEKGNVFMPAEQTGSPMTYMLGGQQYIVVAVGGGNYSAEFIAFRLPRG